MIERYMFFFVLILFGPFKDLWGFADVNQAKNYFDPMNSQLASMNVKYSQLHRSANECFYGCCIPHHYQLSCKMPISICRCSAVTLDDRIVYQCKPRRTSFLPDSTQRHYDHCGSACLAEMIQFHVIFIFLVFKRKILKGG